MYTPHAFREERPESLFALIRDHSFGTLISLANGELTATHLPFLLDPACGPNGTLIGHMARPNPHWHAFDRSPSLAIFQGPHAYISPNWYASGPSVPTWNYTVVHAYGNPSAIHDPDRIRAILEATVATYESDLATQWSTVGLPEEYVTNMARGVVAFEMPIARLEGKCKLGQNRPASDIPTAADGLRARGDQLSLAIADLMLEANRRR